MPSPAIDLAFYGTRDRILSLVAGQSPVGPQIYGAARMATSWRFSGLNMTAETVFDDRYWKVDLSE